MWTTGIEYWSCWYSIYHKVKLSDPERLHTLVLGVYAWQQCGRTLIRIQLCQHPHTLTHHPPPTSTCGTTYQYRHIWLFNHYDTSSLDKDHYINCSTMMSPTILFINLVTVAVLHFQLHTTNHFVSVHRQKFVCISVVQRILAILQQLNFEMNPRVPRYHDVATCTILMQANAYWHRQLKQNSCAGTCTEDVLQ